MAILLRCEIAVRSAHCCLCGVKEEETNCVFFYCRIVWLVWNLYFKWLDILSVTPHDSYSNFLQFCNVSESVNLGIESIWIAVVSEIWSYRNKILFKGGVLDYSEIFSLTQLKVWSLITSKFPPVCFSYSDWYFFSSGLPCFALAYVLLWFLAGLVLNCW